MKIIHQKVNRKELSLTQIKRCHQGVRAALPSDEYFVITTPTELTLIDSDSKNINDLMSVEGAIFDINDIISSQTTVEDLILKDIMHSKIYRIMIKTTKILEKRLKEMNELVSISGKEEYLQRYNEYADLLIEIRSLTAEEFGRLNLKGRKDSLKDIILDAIDNLKYDTSKPETI